MRPLNINIYVRNERTTIETHLDISLDVLDILEHVAGTHGRSMSVFERIPNQNPDVVRWVVSNDAVPKAAICRALTDASLIGCWEMYLFVTPS